VPGDSTAFPEDTPGLNDRIWIVVGVELLCIHQVERREVDHCGPAAVQRTTAAEDFVFHDTDRRADQHQRHTRLFEVHIPNALDLRGKRVVRLSEIGELVEDDHRFLSTQCPK